MYRNAIALLSLIGLSACLTSGVVQTAETAGKDNFQFAIEPGVLGVEAGGGGGAFVPSINISGRYGVTDRFDLGGRIGSTLIEVQGKYMFTEPAEDEIQVSIAPHIGGLAAGGSGAAAGFFWIKSPVLIDIPVGSSDLVLGPGPRIVGVASGGGGDSAGGVIFGLGTSIGYAARVGERARIMPEFAFDVPIVAAGAAGGETASVGGLAGNGFVWTFQVGVLLGGRPRMAME